MTRSLTFPEVLVGDVAFRSSVSAGASLSQHRFTMRLVWFIPDLDAFFDDPRHAVVITGRVLCEPLGGELEVPSGTVELFAEDAGRKVMNYRLDFPAGNNERMELTGAKAIVHDRVKDLWPDTTTLPIELRKADSGELVISGIVRLNLVRILRAMAGMRATGGVKQAAGTIIAFYRFFVANLASVYLHEVRPARQRAAVG